ncbi:probable glucitol transport protein GutA [Anaerobium acetethylicum]|uniref:Probable glucitol transport protein GutA n=1 Tax=Anaerobium acetethylicum TaxID=1619234 RepID=A0A1D3TX35_9FIRM|nr:probable glucitol transport protein GutA [Anaerobium acetethylicum]
MIGLLVGASLSPILTKTIGIRNNLVISSIITIGTSVSIFFIPAQKYGVYIYIIIILIDGFFNGLATPAQSTLMPNAIDDCIDSIDLYC